MSEHYDINLPAGDGADKLPIDNAVKAAAMSAMGAGLPGGPAAIDNLGRLVAPNGFTNVIAGATNDVLLRAGKAEMEFDTVQGITARSTAVGGQLNFGAFSQLLGLEATSGQYYYSGYFNPVNFTMNLNYPGWDWDSPGSNWRIGVDSYNVAAVHIKTHEGGSPTATAYLGFFTDAEDQCVTRQGSIAAPTDLASAIVAINALRNVLKAFRLTY